MRKEDKVPLDALLRARIFAHSLLFLSLILKSSFAFADDCAWGDRIVGHPPGVVWQFAVYPDVVRVEGTGTKWSDALASTEFQLQLERHDESARKGKLYKAAIALTYKQLSPRPRSLKAVLTVGTTKSEFQVQERPYSGGGSSRGRIDLSPLAPTLLDAIRRGRDASLTLFVGETEYLGQAYDRWLQPKIQLMESQMEKIFGLTDAKKCKLPEQTPYQRMGPFL